MPTFQIHDSDTGFKLMVEGPEEPTESEAADLVQQELGFLSTNLYHGAGNRFMLDVGPLSDMRRISDEDSAAINEGDARLAAIERAKERVHEVFKNRGDIGEAGGAELFKNIYEDELRNAPPLSKPNATDKIGLQLNPNTLLIVAHGAKTGGLGTHGGQDFTLHNIAQLLGPKSNLVHNVINVACYGGKCNPADYQSVFPNVTNVRSADFTMPNTLSINALQAGDYFATNTTPGIWKRYGTNWMPQLPDYTK